MFGPARLSSRTWSGFGRRRISSNVLKISEEARWALKNGKPLVALESTIITHGMPYPDNLRVAKEVEAAVREENCVPATIAVIRGQLRVGLNDSQLEELADGRNGAIKVSRRDLPRALSQGLNGGTTVSATMIAAHLAGIPIFATGGIGGVHRDGQRTLDISADLRELGRTPVTVVSAGVKSILDIGRTLEYLETEGVTVALLADDASDGHFPAFFTPRSGYQAPTHLTDVAQAARLIESRDSLGLQSGILLAVPIPASKQEQGELMEEAIREALTRANSEGITGHRVTPYVLSLVNRLTSGISQELNRVLVKNNGRVAARIAVELNSLSSGFEKEGGSETGNWRKASRNHPETEMDTRPVVVGASVVDIVACASRHDDSSESDGCTYPGQVILSAGGVARNVADCLTRVGARPYFVSRVGDDLYAGLLAVANPLMETAGIEVSKEATAKCSIFLNADKECQILVGDFNINSGISPRLIGQHEEVIKRSAMLITDANVPAESVDFLLDVCQKYRVPAWYEPTDIKKAHSIFGSPKWTTVTYASPNLHELRIMAKATGNDPGSVKDLLENWSVELLKEYCWRASSSMMENWKLMVVTSGSRGVVTLARKGECLSGVSRLEAPLEVTYFPPLKPNPQVVSVTGAGDCLVAGMVSSILKGHGLEECVRSGQRLAQLSVASTHCVPPTINAGSIHPF